MASRKRSNGARAFLRVLSAAAALLSTAQHCPADETPPDAIVGEFCTLEFLPRLGKSATLLGVVSFGTNAVCDACTVDVRAEEAGVRISPTHVCVRNAAAKKAQSVKWIVNAGTNGIVNLHFAVKTGNQETFTADKRIVFMPRTDPDFSAKAWNPPVTSAQTYYVDSKGGDDTRDGLTPKSAWRTLGRASRLTLGAGERLLLKRGSVFNEELLVSVRGTVENWAEIGAYGEGMRPQIRRNRHINDRCGLLVNPEFLVVRDLIFCNAGAGLSLVCEEPQSGHILVERCLAHHIEGLYRFNSHGIPEWRDEPGPGNPGGGGCGIQACGIRTRDFVLRDCEFYQCSKAFWIEGVDTFVTSVFCHDNFAHNTSPHPFNIASRSYMTDCVFDKSGYHAAAGTMGVMLAKNNGFVVKGCHFLNQPDSGSPDQGGIDFEWGGENCLVEKCTFRNNAGAAIEVLGLVKPQIRNLCIRRCRFDRNNYARKNGPAEIQIWGGAQTPCDIACSNGRIEDNGFVLIPGVLLYVNESRSAKDWTLFGNREFDFVEDMNRAFPYNDPPDIFVCSEIWTDCREVALSAKNSEDSSVMWEQTEGPANVVFACPDVACTKAFFPLQGDYRIQAKADNGQLWRTARTAVHILPYGARTFRAWDFSANLDMQGWSVENAGTDYEFLPGKTPFWNSKSHPVRLVCNDYMVVAVKDAGEACIVTPCEYDVGVICGGQRANALRVRMQNHTTSRRMRLWWQKCGHSPQWDIKNSIAFDVKAMDDDDAIYTIPLPHIGSVKQLKISFSDASEKITGTVRIDYIWIGLLLDERKMKGVKSR